MFTQWTQASATAMRRGCYSLDDAATRWWRWPRQDVLERVLGVSLDLGAWGKGAVEGEPAYTFDGAEQTTGRCSRKQSLRSIVRILVVQESLADAHKLTETPSFRVASARASHRRYPTSNSTHSSSSHDGSRRCASIRRPPGAAPARHIASRLAASDYLSLPLQLTPRQDWFPSARSGRE